MGARRVIGVMGGLGPAATVDFYAKLVAATPAARDQDHLHVLIDADPTTPNRNEAIAGTGPSPEPQLIGMATRLAVAGAEALFMVCNAAHAYAPAVRAAVGVPLVSIIEETAAAAMAAAPGLRRVGVLAAAGAQDARLYATEFARHGVATLEPRGELRERFMALLYRIKGGDAGPDVRSGMRAIACELVAQGAEVVVAGCTEVPLVLTQAELGPTPLVSSTDALVAAAVAIGTGARPL